MTIATAQAALQQARDELLAFSDEHPDRVDSTIARATDFAASAADMLDADFYITHDADPEHA